MGTWLLTGGAGYIGGHVVRAMQSAGLGVVVLDDLSTGLASRVPPGVPFVRAAVQDTDAVVAALVGHGVVGVIHLAAKKAVAESCEDPLRYYAENVGGLVALLGAMRTVGVARLVYSSSAAVYGTVDGAAVAEGDPTRPDSPYGRTKLVGEWIVADAAAAYSMSAVCLRYFNVVGAACPDLGDTGSENLFPRVLSHLEGGTPVPVFGSDYPTPDGTCVRDYIHVADLADAHVAALALTAEPATRAVVNIGCGRGYSVLEVLSEFERVSGHPVPHVLAPRRPGDPPAMVARTDHAAAYLGWSAQYGLSAMVTSTRQAALQRTAPNAGGVDRAYRVDS